MRIVIDMQGTQTTGNRFRGIGRYTMSFAQAVVRNRGEHEIILALSGLFPDTIEPIRAAFDNLLSQESIRVWYAPGPVRERDPGNDWRRETAELIREAFFASLNPDVIHISSLFEGYGDDAVTSIGRFDTETPVSVTLYDLIPLLNSDHYLKPNSRYERHYLRKVEYLKRAAIYLAISESSRQEGIRCLGRDEQFFFNILGAVESRFQQQTISEATAVQLKNKYGISRPFVLYTGGIDYRKNVEGLIRAFSSLSVSLRKSHQLVIVCSISSESRYRLEQLAAQQGLSKDEIVLTGFVPDNDLVELYNLCVLFVFPSWHEGFGLPVLEATRCGAPVIGSNMSSIPEIIGWSEALFDPHSDGDIAKAIERALTDVDYRQSLINNGKVQAQRFSWDETARRAITAMEMFHAERFKRRAASTSIIKQRPRLAYISPLPPERSGISYYSAELLPELINFYEIDVIGVQEKISDPWIKRHCPYHTVQWFIENHDQYDRILYHFGNSIFHQHMFKLLKAIPGVVVLHDFYLSGIISYMDRYDQKEYWLQELYKSHGYIALHDRFNAKDAAEVVWKYPCSLSVIQDSLGIIVHSTYSIKLARHWYGDDTSDWVIIPLLRTPQLSEDKGCARKSLGFHDSDFIVCSFGGVGPTKLNHRLLQVWLKSDLAQYNNCYLIFVGENDSGDYGQILLNMIRESGLIKNVRITGWVDKEIFNQYLVASDVAVQLRTLSRGETSGTVLDCMNYGLATIVNAHGTMADLSDEAVWKLPDEFTDEQLIEALEILKENSERRHKIGKMAREIILSQHSPHASAKKYRDAIERFYQDSASSLPGLYKAIAELSEKAYDADLIQIANALAKNVFPRNEQRQLLVDISELVQRDVKTGIQRVVRSILKEWLINPPDGYRVEPVYSTVEHGYRYARRFTQNFLGGNTDVLQDDPIDFAPGDIFFALDLNPQVQVSKRVFYQELQRHGVKTLFVVYDLLCVLMPQYFVPMAADGFSQWLAVVAESDGAICISKATADELERWINKNGSVRQRPFRIAWFHLGADVDNLHSTKEMPEEAAKTLDQLRSRPTFLMVGTLEPRKAHTQVLDAFEKLWPLSIDVNLVIVGKQGWMVEELVARLRVHPELGNRLFWLEGISDEYLEKVYEASTCLIAASYGEGFGLPLIEAAQHNLPIIARDILVFKEVAGDYAFYFEDKKEPEAIAEAIEEWIDLYETGKQPKSDDMPWFMWEQSAKTLADKIIKNADL